MVDFIGLGAQKSGTSWVYTCLYEHPEVCIPVKELHFFSRSRFEKGRDWYESHFNTCEPSKKSGEFSTSYLYSKEAPTRIHSLYPRAKLIAILRNPVERALSQYKNAIKAGEITESVSFTEYTQKEESVIKQGLYHEQLERYLKLFSQEQMLVLVYEDIKKDPEAFMRTIYRFLEIDDSFIASMLHTEVNIGRTPKSVLLGRMMHHTSEFLRKIGLHKLVHAVRQSGLPNLIHTINTKKVEPTKEIDTKALAQYFIADVEKLSFLLKRDLKAEWNI